MCRLMRSLPQRSGKHDCSHDTQADMCCAAVLRYAVLCCGLQILGVHLGRRGLPLAPDVQVDEIAAMTMGFTGADLANLVNEVRPAF